MTAAALWLGWALAAVVLIALEVLVPGFLFLGFAIGAACLAIALLAGLTLALALQLLLFALLSLTAWYLLRRIFGRPGNVKIWERDINDDP